MLPMLNADMQRNLYMLGGIIAKDLELDTLTKCAKAFTARLGRSGTFSQVALLWAGWRGILLRQGIDPGDGPHRDSVVLGKASLTHLDMHRTLMSHVISSLTPRSKRQCFGRDTMHVREGVLGRLT